jgi:hypothetical protein
MANVWSKASSKVLSKALGETSGKILIKYCFATTPTKSPVFSREKFF